MNDAIGARHTGQQGRAASATTPSVQPRQQHRCCDAGARESRR